MRGLLSERPWSFESRDRNDLEERVANWMARQEPTSWVVSSIVLGTTFMAMVLFALTR